MKKRFSFVGIVCCIVLSCCMLMACGDDSSKTARVPVYQGMVIKSGVASGSNNAASGKAASEVVPGDEGLTGDTSDKNDKVDQDEPFVDSPEIKDVIDASIKVDGAKEDIYYADKNADIFITIKVSNPDNYEIMSFTLNGKKYSSYMFEAGSDMENLILKFNVGGAAGFVDYTIDAIKYIDGTDIKDVLMEGDKTVKAGVRADDQTYVTVANTNVTLNSVSFKATVIDLYSLIEKSEGFVKAVLYDGKTLIKTQDIKVGESNIVFGELSPNTLYQYAIVAYYDDLSGTGKKLNAIYEFAFYTKTIVLFDSVKITQSTVAFNCVWEESFANKKIEKLELTSGGKKVKDIADTATEITELLSNTEYQLKAYYKNLSGAEEKIEIAFKTIAKKVPSATLTIGEATFNTLDFELSVTDIDSVGAVTSIKIYKGTAEVASLTDLSLRKFEGLLSNTLYMVEVEYTYDLNDGTGNKVIKLDVNEKTKAKKEPQLNVEIVSTSVDSIDFELSVTDADSVGAVTSIKIYKGTAEVASLTDLSLRKFDGLLSNTLYMVEVEYTYDLNDGNGDIKKTFEVSKKTDLVFTARSTECANTMAVSQGEKVVIKVSLENSTDIVAKKAKVNGKIYETSNASTAKNVIIEIAVENQFVGGDTVFTVESLYILEGGKEREAVLVGNKTASCFINGEIIVEKVEAYSGDRVLVDYALPADRVTIAVTLANETGYEIDKIMIGGVEYTNNITVVNKNLITVPANFSTGWNNIDVTSLTYSNENVGSITKSFSIARNRIFKVSSDDVVLVSTAEDLKNMNESKFYKLANDIDLKGASWDTQGNFSGVFDGNGKSITNMNVVGEYANKDVDLGLFKRGTGLIKNLTIKDSFTVVTLKFAGDIKYTVRYGSVAAYCDDLVLNTVVSDAGVSISGNSSATGGLMGYAQNSSLINCKNTGAINGNTNVGGLFGYAQNSSLVKCENTGEISGNLNVGGLIGNGSSLTIEGCNNTGTISGNSDVGGLLGYASNISLINCENIGEISGKADVGGLIGGGSGNIEGCRNSGKITAGEMVGGLLGRGYSNSSLINCENTGEVSGTTRIGGLIGYGDNLTIKGCRNSGKITAVKSDVGGLLGYAIASSLINCENTGAISGNSSVGGLIGNESSMSIEGCRNSGEVTII